MYIMLHFTAAQKKKKPKNKTETFAHVLSTILTYVMLSEKINICRKVQISEEKSSFSLLHFV